MNTQAKLQLEGLSNLDRDELEYLLKDNGVEAGDYEFSERTPTAADKAQDFGLTALTIALGPIAIAAVGAWLEKKREHEKFAAMIRTWDANGQKRYESRITWDSSRSAPPPAEIIEKLSEAAKMDPSDLQKRMAAIAG